VSSANGLRAILWEDEEGRVPLEADMSEEPNDPILAAARQQLEEYFGGRRTDFDLPLDPVGTPFQLSVWKILRAIPFGETITYGEQARRLGDPNKARAAGAANGKNPLSIVVPCHRVIGANGSLTGFAGGLEAKDWLLSHERFGRRSSDHHAPISEM
jgi:methylated-DNA-[protein]-cysteine S-methyltransferase